MKFPAFFAVLFTFVLWMFSVTQVQAQDYVLAFSDRYSWRIENVPDRCEDCTPIIRFDRNYVMYILIEEVLYVLPPDGSGPAVFDLEAAQRELGISFPPKDMIPFEDSTILLVTELINGNGLKDGRQILLYNTHNQTMNFVDKTLADMWHCGNPWFDTNFIERMGPEKDVVLCLNGLVVIYDVTTLAIKTRLGERQPIMEGRPPVWQRVIAGPDNRLYLYNSRFPELSMPLSQWGHIKRYDPVTGEWSYTLIPDELFARVERAYGSILRPVTWPIEFDKDGNIYFQYSFEENNIAKHDFVKTDATGRVIWHFTEVELPNEQIMFLDNDLFVAIESGRLLQVMPNPASTSSR